MLPAHYSNVSGTSNMQAQLVPETPCATVHSRFTWQGDHGACLYSIPVAPVIGALGEVLRRDKNLQVEADSQGFDG